MKEIKLTEDQENASNMFLDFMLNQDDKVMVIQGAAGTGKSTLVRYLIDTFNAKSRLYAVLLGDNDTPKYDLQLTATTNKAAVVLGELTGRSCGTIHSFLGLIPQRNYETGGLDFVPGKRTVTVKDLLLVIDEASFISDDLFLNINKFTKDCKILLIGDQYQLAPVNQEVPIMDRVTSFKATLDKIMRHGGPIAEAGAKFRYAVQTGDFSPIVTNGVDIVYARAKEFEAMIREAFTDPDFDGDKARVLAWRNDTVTQYNSYIRTARGTPRHYVEGDELMTNKPITYKGAVVAGTEETVHITGVIREEEQHGIQGRIVTINEEYDLFLPDYWPTAAKVIASFKRKGEMKTYFQLVESWLDLRPAFASTVHKSQGSTYDTVFINLSDIGRCPTPSDVARMMYVAITRAAKRVVLNGALPPKYTGACNASQKNSIFA